MSVPVAAIAKYLPTFLAAFERLVKLWRERKTTVIVTRKRPPAAVVLTLLTAISVSGCAAGSVADLSSDDLVQLCQAIAPCEPCPPPPVCPDVPPPAPAPDVVPEPPADKGCDRDGLAPSGTAVWKPQSDNDGKAAFVTPASATCEKGLTIWYGKKTRKSERGSSNGVRANGCRLAWRFSRPGAGYGNNVRVVCAEADDTERIWKVPRGAARWEGR